MPPGGAIDRNLEPGAVAYCRAARRIRHAHARQPGRMYRELRSLSERHGAARETVSAHPALGAGRCEAFSFEVSRRMDGPVLRHAERRALLRAARRAGIGRFEANLIIAAVQHRRGREKPVPASGQTVGARNWSVPVLLALSVQALVAWGAWRVFWG